MYVRYIKGKMIKHLFLCTLYLQALLTTHLVLKAFETTMKDEKHIIIAVVYGVVVEHTFSFES